MQRLRDLSNKISIGEKGKVLAFLKFLNQEKHNSVDFSIKETVVQFIYHTLNNKKSSTYVELLIQNVYSLHMRYLILLFSLWVSLQFQV